MLVGRPFVALREINMAVSWLIPTTYLRLEVGYTLFVVDHPVGLKVFDGGRG
jgi:hypothetical protein